MSIFQPRARSRTNHAASSGPPTTITTVLMFCTHCGAILMPHTCRSTLFTANSCKPFGAIWYSDQNTSEPRPRIRYAHMLFFSRASRCFTVR